MKTRSFARQFAVLLAGTALCGCGRSGPTAPSAGDSRPGFTLSGTITDDRAPTPQPVAGAVVRLNGRVRVEGMTNQDGLYSLVGVAEGIYAMTIEANGFETTSRVANIVRDTRVDVQLQHPPQSSISGFVYEVVEGRQVPLADVWVQEFGVEREGHTNADGHFYISSVYDGPDGLWFGKPGYEVRTLRITVQGETTGINVQLTREQ